MAKIEEGMEVCDSCEVHENLLKIVNEKMPEETELYDLAELFKVFGDSTRMRILFVLFEAEVCVCDLAEALNMTQSAVSHQLRILKQNKLVKNRSDFTFTSETKDYGIQVVAWKTPFGEINLMTHPLFSFESSNRNSMVIFEPANLKFRYIDDTTFYADGEKQNTGPNRIDGTKEEFLTEAGLEFHHPVGWGFWNGIGLNP